MFKGKRTNDARSGRQFFSALEVPPPIITRGIKVHDRKGGNGMNLRSGESEEQFIRESSFLRSRRLTGYALRVPGERGETRTQFALRKSLARFLKSKAESKGVFDLSEKKSALLRRGKILRCCGKKV